MEEIMNRSESSVEITRNAKGNVQINVKVYNVDSEKAKVEAVKVFNEIKKEYPFG